MPTFAVVLAAAGKSSRFAAGVDSSKKKPFVELAGRPVWKHSLDVLRRRADVVQVVMVVSPDDESWFREQYAQLIDSSSIVVVPGGEQRSDSVGNALRVVDSAAEFIAIHDAARPCIDPVMVERVFAEAASRGNAVAAVPVSSTVKRSADGSVVEQTVDRSGLYLSQTPQVFAAEPLKEAFSRIGDLNPTDEAQLLEMLGMPVYLVAGSALNRKITTQEDLEFAEVGLEMLQRKYNSRPVQSDNTDLFDGNRLA